MSSTTSGVKSPFIAQGTMNRLRTSIVVAQFPALNILSVNMGKSFASLSFSGPFVTQIQTATGIVNSPEPFVMATVSVGILRSQAMGSAWLSQIQQTSILGRVTVYSDTSAFPAVPILDASILEFNPSAYDGNDATIAVTISGVFRPNSNMWNLQ